MPNQKRTPLSIHGQDVSKMRFRAYVLYSRNPEFAKRAFPEFEEDWQLEKDEWLRHQPENIDQFYLDYFEAYNRILNK